MPAGLCLVETFLHVRSPESFYCPSFEMKRARPATISFRLVFAPPGTRVLLAWTSCVFLSPSSYTRRVWPLVRASLLGLHGNTGRRRKIYHPTTVIAVREETGGQTVSFDEQNVNYRNYVQRRVGDLENSRGRIFHCETKIEGLEIS